MPVFYIDTSALVKRYRTEQGTGVVEVLLSDPLPEDRFFLSFLSVIELTSGILRLARGRQLREETASEILARFRGDIRTLFRI
nr:type II toxin-antitoxin system VapC family toxin [Nitrospirota bacterium]